MKPKIGLLSALVAGIAAAAGGIGGMTAFASGEEPLPSDPVYVREIVIRYHEERRVRDEADEPTPLPELPHCRPERRPRPNPIPRPYPVRPAEPDVPADPTPVPQDPDDPAKRPMPIPAPYERG